MLNMNFFFFFCIGGFKFGLLIFFHDTVESIISFLHSFVFQKIKILVHLNQASMIINNL